jgi:hypothetical protein
MTTPTLTGIPVELLLEIAKHLSDSPAALSALSRTNVPSAFLRRVAVMYLRLDKRRKPETKRMTVKN